MSRQWQIKLSLFLKCSTFAHSWPAMFKWLAKETQTYLSRGGAHIGAQAKLSPCTSDMPTSLLQLGIQAT